MAKQNQIIAIEKSAKSKAHNDITAAYQLLQKSQLLTGITRTYQSKDDEGEKLPSELNKVQLKVESTVSAVSVALTDLFDITFTKDVGNTVAKADVSVDGQVLVKDAPVTFLLFLEKQLVDIHTFIKKLPVLDSAENWSVDVAQDCYKSETSQTVRTKKVPRTLVKSPPTDKHPAQVEVWHEDIVVGTWSTVKYSGAIPTTRANVLLSRVEKLARAVKTAREEANSVQVESKKAGEAVLGWLFA